MTIPVEQWAKDRFDESFGTLDDAVARKAALAHPTRYAILSYLHENGDVSRADLATIVEDGVESHVGDLIDAGLAARIGAPDDQPQETVYRITPSGRREIETDMKHIEHHA
jgi:DNA-binding transcriptional ArsR family regulator